MQQQALKYMHTQYIVGIACNQFLGKVIHIKLGEGQHNVYDYSLPPRHRECTTSSSCTPPLSEHRLTRCVVTRTRLPASFAPTVARSDETTHVAMCVGGGCSLNLYLYNYSFDNYTV